MNESLKEPQALPNGQMVGEPSLRPDGGTVTLYIQGEEAEVCVRGMHEGLEVLTSSRYSGSALLEIGQGDWARGLALVAREAYSRPRVGNGPSDGFNPMMFGYSYKPKN